MEALEIQIDSLAAGGDGVGRDPCGRVVFAPRTAPGDRAIIEPTQQSKSFARGKILRIDSASPLRTEPACPYFDSGAIETSCGGCAWQHLAYAAQLVAKREIVRDALLRIGGVANAGEVVRSCVPSPAPLAYRNKADFIVEKSFGNAKVGFYAPRSRRLVDLENCPIQQEPNNHLLRLLREAFALRLAEPFDARGKKATVSRFVARIASSGEAIACAITTEGAWPEEHRFADFLRSRLPGLVGVLRQVEGRPAQLIGSEGREWLVEDVAGLQLRVSGVNFFQINSSLVALLQASVLQFAGVGPGEFVLDLFCGVGLFGLALAASGARVMGIELSPEAVRDAELNSRSNNLSAEFIAGDVTHELRRQQRPDAQAFWAPDGSATGRSCEVACVVLDPPRAGAAECLSEILDLRPRRIVYVSCDPATLARDVKTLHKGGYWLVDALPIDMFPQTAHVETIVRLDRD